MSKELGVKGSGTSWDQKVVSRDNGSQSIWDWLWFSCGMEHSGRGLLSFCSSIGGAFILAGELGVGLSFYVVYRQFPDIS